MAPGRQTRLATATRAGEPGGVMGPRQALSRSEIEKVTSCDTVPFIGVWGMW